MSYATAFKAGLMPDEDTDLVTWAENYFCLPRESSAEYGRFRIDRTPMIREILLALSPTSPVQEVVVQKPTQLAGTTAGIIFMLGTADMQPGPTLLIQPTAELARSFSKKKLTPAVKATVAGSGRLTARTAASVGCRSSVRPRGHCGARSATTSTTRPQRWPPTPRAT